MVNKLPKLSTLSKKIHLENTLKEKSKRLETFKTTETMLTFLTIENNNLNIHSDSSIKSERGHTHLLTDPLTGEGARRCYRI